jgi:hypothetical protein
MMVPFPSVLLSGVPVLPSGLPVPVLVLVLVLVRVRELLGVVLPPVLLHPVTIMTATMQTAVLVTVNMLAPETSVARRRW